jgi:cadmium resistance protein CadD (predicted permease)
MIKLLAVAVAAYASTNIDDLLLLCAFFALPAYSVRQIVIGQFMGIGILVAVSMVCALAAMGITSRYVGLLGLAPIYLGASRLLNGSGLTQRRLSSSSQIMTVIVATLADGGDNIATYVSIFASSSGTERFAIVVAFAVLTGFWCWMAATLVKHPVAGYMFRKWSARLLPFMLMAIGIILLWRSGSFGMIR